MKNKILEKLKTVTQLHGKNVSLKTLEFQAELLSTLIVTDEALATFDAEGLVKNLQGNINHTASEAVAAALATKTKTPEQIAAEKAEAEKVEAARIAGLTDDNKGLTPEAIAKIIADQLAPIQAKLDGYEKNKSTEQIISDAKGLISKTYGKFNASEEKISEMAMKHVLAVNASPESAEKLVELYEAQYNDLTATFSAPSLTPIDKKEAPAEGTKSPETLAFEAQLIANGDLPPLEA